MGSKLFVGNLEFSTTKEQLEQLFGEVGSILDVFLPTDRATGKPRGFAFVEFATEQEAATAITRFDGHELGGRALRVNAAEERRPGQRGGPSFGGGGFGAGGFGGGGGFGGSNNAPPKGFGGKSKGSRRNLRAKKRSL